jgi:hypothetical protein
MEAHKFTKRIYHRAVPAFAKNKSKEDKYFTFSPLNFFFEIGFQI